MKLSKAQMELLIEIGRDSQSVVDSYPPAKKLVALGLAEWEKIGLSELLTITPAGRAALEKETQA